jgi:hypothetical protein
MSRKKPLGTLMDFVVVLSKRPIWFWQGCWLAFTLTLMLVLLATGAQASLLERQTLLVGACTIVAGSTVLGQWLDALAEHLSPQSLDRLSRLFNFQDSEVVGEEEPRRVLFGLGAVVVPPLLLSVWLVLLGEALFGAPGEGAEVGFVTLVALGLGEVAYLAEATARWWQRRELEALLTWLDDKPGRLKSAALHSQHTAIRHRIRTLVCALNNAPPREYDSQPPQPPSVTTAEGAASARQQEVTRRSRRRARRAPAAEG